MQHEVADLQTKLHQAGKKLTAINQPVKEDLNTSNIVNSFPSQKVDADMVSMPEMIPFVSAMPGMDGMQSAIFSANAGT